MQDLVVALEDADGRILYARFFRQDGTASAFAALESVLRDYGRFAALYRSRQSATARGPAKWLTSSTASLARPCVGSASIRFSRAHPGPLAASAPSAPFKAACRSSGTRDH
jgi:hypothetical protein